jgi:hypothetical protein
MAEVTSSGVPLMGAVNKIKDSAMHVFAQRKPMSEILDRTAYQRPGSFSEVRLLDRVQTQARDSRRTCSSEIFPFRRKGFEKQLPPFQ